MSSPSNVADIYPLSPAQQGMLMVNLLSADRSEYYFDQFIFTLTGRLDAALWREAWRRVVARHGALRTQFAWERRERPLQVVRAEVELPWEELDLRDLPEAERERRLDALLRADHARGFDLSRAPLLRATLVSWEEGVAKFVWSFHHLILDGWSISLVFADVLALYAALAQGRAPDLLVPRPYGDYIAWLERQDRGEAEAFWRRELLGFDEPTPLPFDGIGEVGEAGDAERESGWASEQELGRIPAATVRSLTAFARGNGLTLNTLFQGAWSLLLARLARRDEATFGAVVSGRPGELPGVESMVGLFINALPVRVRIDPAQALLPWLAELQDRQIEQRRFEHSLLEEVQAWAGLPRERPLFSSLLIFQNFPLNPLAESGLSGSADLQIRASRLKESTHYPLALYAAPEGEEMALGLSYHRHRFDAGSARRLLGMLGHLLAGFVHRPGARLDEVALLGAAEEEELLAAGRGPIAPEHGATTVLHRFAAQAAATPDAVAVESGEARLTYAALAAASDRLAGHLRSLGVGRGEVVGIGLERSLDLIVSLLATWKTGAAYLPLDPAYPVERLAFMVADSGARVLITVAALAARLPGSAVHVHLDADRERLGSAARGFVPGDGVDSVDSGDATYVLYTSGSTGTPKGVVVEHAALAGYVASAGAAYGVGPADRVLQFASISFDTSAEEIWPCLTHGATLVLREPGIGSFDGFLRTIGRQGITLLDLPTAYWHELVIAITETAEAGERDVELPPSVRLVILGGEEAQAARLAAWRERVGAGVRLINTYGPTEATIVATQHDLTLSGTERVGRVPIGRAVPNARTYLLGAGMEILPTGVDGELWIGGTGLARGYLGRPELTAERFRPDPFAGETGAAGDRLYRTGDLVRRLPDGNLVFRGRVDSQVKIRGIRIELGEVEAALRRLSGVREAAVVVQEDGARRLVAFAVPAGAEIQAGELRAALRSALPEAMVPAVLVLLPALPLTASGKVDRTALAHLDVGAAAKPEEDGEGPRTPVEEVLAGIWGELLRVDRVGRNDDFFHLGGHSLLVAQALSRIRQALGVEVPLVELFRKPTVAELAAWIETSGRGADPLSLPPIRRVPRDGRALPLSFAQERVWFLDQLTPGGNLAYNFQVAIRFRGPLDVEILERTLAEIVRRHEVLRTSFPALAEGRPVQVISEASPLRLVKIELSGFPPEEREERAEAIIEEQIQTPFDLARGPLIRWRLLRHDAGFHTLVQVEHHFVHDGWSLAIFLRELKALYTAFSAGEPSLLAEPPVQYADYAVWQREWMEGEAMERLLGYWTGRLAGSPEALEIATDRPRPPQGSFRGDIALLPVQTALYDTLRGFARRQGFTLYMTMLAGFLALLSRYTGEEDVVIGTSNANRRAREIEGMIGMVVNSLVLRADLSGRPSFREHLSRVRELALATYTHQDMPFERLVQELRFERRPGRNPLFQLMFNFHDAPIPDFRFADLELFPEVRGNRTAKMDMNVIVVPRAEQRVGREGHAGDGEEHGALLHWEYNTDLFDLATVERMAAHFQTLLAGAVADPRLALAELPLLSAAERAEVLGAFNNTANDYPRDASIPELFALQAERTPLATAVLFGDESLTYGQLDAEANRLAHYLRGRGVGAGDLVALAVERSLALVPAILGILKCGAGYVPLDPAYPLERLSFMLADSGARLVLGEERSLARLRSSEVVGLPAVVSLDADREAILGAPATAISPQAGPGGASDIAYVMYTSGSTGRPKGVAVTHRNVVRLVFGKGGGAVARFGPEEVFLQLAPISFDASTLELWGPLLHGGRLAVFPPESPSLESLGAALARYGVTTLWLTAGLFHQMVEGNVAALRPLSQLLAGGDVLSPEHVRRALSGLPGLTLINGYGPTEGTTFTCCHPMREPGEVGTTVPIGRPIGNASVYVVDGELRLVPAGVPGELLLGGDGLALGYLGRLELTAERFVPDPFGPALEIGKAGERLYRTGDRARFRADGILEFLGRLDQQVKIRGFRIEPGEIETVLARHPAVREVAVLASPEPGGTERRLVAYVVSVTPREEAPEIAEADLLAVLRRHLAASLPAHMVPAAWVLLPTLPLTANGKVDRRALLRLGPDPRTGTGAGFVAPRTAVEEAVAAIWREVLGVEAVGIGDDFFLLGGHSLSATRVLSRLRRDLGVELPLAALFEHTTLAALAAAIVGGTPANPEEPGAPAAEIIAEEMSEEQLDALLHEMLSDPLGREIHEHR
jgi:amino acid adenylation domain-containing protein